MRSLIAYAAVVATLASPLIAEARWDGKNHRIQGYTLVTPDELEVTPGNEFKGGSIAHNDTGMRPHLAVGIIAGLYSETVNVAALTTQPEKPQSFVSFGDDPNITVRVDLDRKIGETWYRLSGTYDAKKNPKELAKALGAAAAGDKKITSEEAQSALEKAIVEVVGSS